MTLRHKRIRLDDEPSRHLLTLLDGTRTRSELLPLMREYFAREGLAADSPEPKPSLEDLNAVLARMAEHALLLA
jgi:hypothetical protein